MAARNKTPITRYKGKITCNRSILLSIIDLATKEISGVSALASSFKSKIKSAFSNNKNPGVSIRFNPNGALTVDVYIRIYYGSSVPDIAYKIQENIKNGIAAMVDMKTAKVNVHVMGVDFENEAQDTTLWGNMRRKAREISFMLIYEEQFNKDRNVEFSFDFLKSEKILEENSLDVDSELYIKNVLEYYTLNKENIDKILNDNVKDYEPDRIFKIDKALLYLGIVEIFYIKTSPAIVINEVIEISKKYSTDKSAKFINGVLGQIVKKSLI